MGNNINGNNTAPDSEKKQKLLAAILYLTGFKTEREVEAFLNHRNTPTEDDDELQTFTMLINELLEHDTMYELYMTLVQETPSNSLILIEEARITLLNVCDALLGKNRKIYGKDSMHVTDHAIQLVRERVVEVILLSTGFDTTRDLEAFLNGKKQLEKDQELKKVDELSSRILRNLTRDEFDAYLNGDLIKYSINLELTPDDHEVYRKFYLGSTNPTSQG